MLKLQYVFFVCIKISHSAFIRCFLSLIENLAKHMISVRDSVIQVKKVKQGAKES